MRRIPVIVLVAAIALPVISACESAPRASSVKMGPVDTGANSVEAVRRQLKGTWELVTLNLVGPDGTKTPVDARGQLLYDEFGNLSMKGNITGSSQVDPSVLNMTGQAAIDPVTKTVRFRAVAAATPDERLIDPKLDFAHTRYYEFTPDGLTTTVKDAKGAATAVATWKKVD
jgi:hypothetical protein